MEKQPALWKSSLSMKPKEVKAPWLVTSPTNSLNASMVRDFTNQFSKYLPGSCLHEPISEVASPMVVSGDTNQGIRERI